MFVVGIFLGEKFVFGVPFLNLGFTNIGGISSFDTGGMDAAGGQFPALKSPWVYSYGGNTMSHWLDVYEAAVLNNYNGECRSGMV